MSLLKKIVYTGESGSRQIDSSRTFDFTPYIRSYQVEYSDMDASGEKTASGKTVRDLIRTVRTVKCTFRTMTAEEALPLLAVINESQLRRAYHDTFTGAYSEQEDDLLFVYPSVSRSTSLYGTNPKVMYNEISVDFTEF